MCVNVGVYKIATDVEIEQRCSAFLEEKKTRLEQVEKQMETKANKVMVDQLVEEAGRLKDKVTSLAMDMSKINQKCYMVRDESLEKTKEKKYSGKRPTRKQRKGGPRSRQ